MNIWNFNFLFRTPVMQGGNAHLRVLVLWINNPPSKQTASLLFAHQAVTTSSAVQGSGD